MKKMKNRVTGAKPPQHQRYEMNYHVGLAETMGTWIITLIVVLAVIAIVAWRQSSPVLLDSTAFQTNSATVGSAFSGYNPKTRETDLGHYSGSNYPSGFLVNYIPLDLSRDVELNTDLSFDTQMQSEGFAVVLRPASTRAAAWDMKPYGAQGFGIAGFSQLIGFKLDLHPTSESALQKEANNEMYSSDPMDVNVPFGAFIATGVDARGVPRSDQPGYLQVLDSGKAVLSAENVENIKMGVNQHFTFNWNASSQTMTVEYGGQKWKHVYSHSISSKRSYWLMIASSNSNENKKFHTNIKINSFSANISPASIKWRFPLLSR